MNPIVFDLHLGDTANFSFGSARFCGLAVELPLRIRNVGPGPLTLIVRTSAIETLANWQRHLVLLDGSLLGQLGDATGQPAEEHRFEVPAALLDLEAVTLTIRVGTAVPGLADDFVLKEIELEGADLLNGWT